MEDPLNQKCANCGKEEPDTRCNRCEKQLHKKCVVTRSLRSGEGTLCNDCTPEEPLLGDVNLDQSLRQKRASGTTALPAISEYSLREAFRQSGFGANSTSVAAQQQARRAEEDRMDRMERMMEMMGAQISVLTQTSAAAPAEGRNFSRNGTNVSLTTWRDQLDKTLSALNVSREHVELTKEQRSRRKDGDTELPIFDGDSAEWLNFIQTFQETTEECGFTARENLKRLKAALKGDAYQMVVTLLPYPHNVEKIIQRLYLGFGQPAKLLEAAISRAAKIAPLSDNLHNLSEFSGEIERVKHTILIAGGKGNDQCLMLTLTKKLPLYISLEYTRCTMDGPLGTISELSDYLLALMNEAIGVGREVTTSSGRNKVRKVEKTLLAAPAQEEEKPAQAAPPESTGCSFKCKENHEWAKCPKFRAMDTKLRFGHAKRQRRCFLCLKRHFPKPCERTTMCSVNQCGMKHHELLHRSDSDAKKEVVNLAVRTHTLFKILPVKVSAEGGVERSNLLMDSGSSVSLIKTSLARKLGLEGRADTMRIQWMNGAVKEVKSERVTLEVELPFGDQDKIDLELHTIDELTLPPQTLSQELLSREGLSHIAIDADEGAKAEILLGQDHAIVMRAMESVVGRSGRVVASKTPLGWVVEGACSTEESPMCFFATAEHPSRLEELVEDFIEGEHFGLLPDDVVHYESDECVLAREQMTKNTILKDGRYETGLLWRAPPVTLPNNKKAVMKRHMELEAKLKRNPALWSRLKTLMDDYLAKGYVKAVDPGEVNAAWYLPIFTVLNPMKPDKLRVVWDAAAKFGGVSLNDALVSGPDLTEPLVDVLQRFRTGKYAVTADIMEMFHQVRVRAEDRAMQRFLWRNPGEQLKEYQMEVLMFGANCSPSLAQFAKNVNAERFIEQYPEAVSAIKHKHYVDDYLDSADDEAQLSARAMEVREIHGAGGFKIHKWVANSETILKALGCPSDPNSVTVHQVSAVLGLMWHTEDDDLSFRVRLENWRNDDKALTKRNILRAIMSVYDPLGLASFLTIEPKVLLREIWRLRIDWDTPAPEPICKRWKTWVNEAQETFSNLRIPRWHGTIQDEVELHIFTDASENAIAAAGYVVQRGKIGCVRSLCVAKCKVAPVKTKSIPRLELDGAVLGVRVLNIIRKSGAWRVKKHAMWTDARDVLFWIRSTTRRYSPYVANRVSNILKDTEVGDWRWVPTKENPADWATKYSNRKEGDLWWHGPDFLQKEESEWPDCFAEPDQILEARPVLAVQQKAEVPLILMPSCERVGKWLTLIRSAAIARIFLDVKCKRRPPGSIQPHEEAVGERIVIRNIQKGMDKTAKFWKSLSPFLDEQGIWRMNGRTATANHIPYEARFPAILDIDHPATVKLIAHYHHFSGHQQHLRTINEVRQRFVMRKLRATLNRVINECGTCRLNRVKPVAPEMAVLPKERLASYMAPFSYTGIDCFGPMEVKIGRRREKRYGTLFTCLTTRAIYVELTSSLSAKSCMCAIDSLVARRGLPLEMRSDNGTNFVSASKLYRGPNGAALPWKFNPPGAPHMGGVWERMVGCVKRGLEQLIQEDVPNEEDLRHCLARVEMLVNSRPLTDTPLHAAEEECLTPNHFLIGASSGQKVGHLIGDWDAKEGHKLREEMMNGFWNRWTKAYLPTVTQRKKWQLKVAKLQPKDVVFICDKDYRKGWIRGVIVKVYVDEVTDQVREVTVRAGDGSVYRRPATKVALIYRDQGSM